MGKRSDTKKLVFISHGSSVPQPVFTVADVAVEDSSGIIEGQRLASVVLDERLLSPVAVVVGIVMLVAFMYWVYEISLIAF